MKDDLNSIIKELENTMERSQIIASQANYINRFQTKIDKSTKHLEDFEEKIDELEKGFCIHLYCSSKIKKRKSKNLIHIEHNSNNHLKNLDKNLQKLKYFNTLIDHEIQDQIQTLVCLFFFCSNRKKIFFIF